MKTEYRFYVFALVCLVVGVGWAYVRQSFTVGLIGLIFSVGSSILGRRQQREFEQKEDRIRDLVEERSELKDEILDEKERREAVLEEKKRKNQRLSNLKKALRRKGIDTEYLVEEYGNELKAPLMVLTHFSEPDNNSKEDAEFIRSNLEALDSQMLHGSARIIPPRNFDQDVVSREELENWFKENVLGGRDDLSYKLELLTVTDLTRTFDEDNSIDRKEGRDFETNTVSSLFETDTVVPTEKLLEILSRSERISLEEELRQNIALLVVPSVSDQQMDQILEVQSKIQDSLGGIQRIARTDVETIAETYREHGVDHAEELAEATKQEADRLVQALN